MIPCPECGTQISRSAARCPKCGHSRRSPIVRWTLGVLFAVVASGWLYVWMDRGGADLLAGAIACGCVSLASLVSAAMAK